MSEVRACPHGRRPRWRVTATLLLVVAGGFAASGQHRTLDDRFAPPPAMTRDEWRQRAAYLRQHVLASAGLLPLPEKTPLSPVVFDETTHVDYRVAKVYFESLPGFLVTGNLYRPTGDGPFPAILSPHGHWDYGRLENTEIASVPGRAINLARQGFVVFTYDAIGYNDSRQLAHTFDGRRARLWGLSLGGLQLWNSIRALDFLETLPYVRRDAIGATGASGGGTQTFLLAAVDERVRVAAPVNMISLQMQGGCLCENLPGLRLDTTNVELAATIAPRPLLMVSATGDWTRDTMRSDTPPSGRSTRSRRRSRGCMQSSSTRRTITTATVARRSTPGWRAGCRARRPTSSGRSDRSRRRPCPTFWCFISVRCQTPP